MTRIPREQTHQDVRSIGTHISLANSISCASAITLGAAKALSHFNWSVASDLLGKVGCSGLVGAALAARGAALLVTAKHIPNHQLIHQTLRTIIKIFPSLVVSMVCSDSNRFCLGAIFTATTITIDSYGRMLNLYAKNPILTWSY